MTLFTKAKDVSLKYRLRLALIPALARLANLAGFSWQWIGDRLGREVLLAQVGQITREARRPAQGASGLVAKQDIIFLTMIGGNGYNASVDVVLGLALSRRGHRVRFVLCDQALPACEVKKSNQEMRWRAACGKCWAFAAGYFQAAGLEVIPVSSLLKEYVAGPPSDQWHQFVEAALLKHLQVGTLENQPLAYERRKAFNQAAAISARIGQELVSIAPTRVIMSHGIYCTWGPAMELLTRAGVPVVTYGKGKKRHTQKFNWDVSSDWWGVEAEWNRVKDVELTPAQMSQICAYLQSRKDHSRDTLVYNTGAEQEVAETRRRFNLDPAKPTFTLFTNVLWDAASAQREIAFRNPIEWTLETIKWFAAHPDRQLIVKVHPAESVIGTRQPFADIIRREFPSLPPNVHLIEPGEKVNSWSILKVTDLGLVHTSTVGMELPLEGVPVACVSRTHYRGKGFTIDVQNREEYFNLLEHWRPGYRDMASEKQAALRYAYLLFERYQLPWGYFHEPRHTDVRAFTFSSPDDLLDSSTVALIVDAIEKKTDFLLPR